MNAYELVEIIRQKPAFYLHDGKSLKQLRSLVIGYEIGAREGISSDFRPFNVWLAKELEFGEPTSGWCNMISPRAESDEKAFDLFFELLDRYRKEVRGKQAD